MSEPASAHAHEAKPSGMRRYVPALTWLPKYKGKWLAGDAVAGATVWALLVPEAMGYAGIAGVPVQYGLYAAPLAGLGYLLFGGSRHLFVGPDASVAVISASAVTFVLGAHAATGDFVALTAALALLVGLLYVLFGVLKLGWISKFFAEPVLSGFLLGLGFFVAVGQLPKIVGISTPSGDTVAQFVGTLADIGDWQWTTVAVGAIALVALFAAAKVMPKLPAALIVVILSILAVNAFDLTHHGVDVVGNVPTGFSFVSWSSVDAGNIVSLLPGAFALVLVGYAQSVALAKSFAAEHREPFDPNQELFGYGAANVGAGVLQGFAVTGSLSKSAAAEQAGARSPMLLGVTGILVLVTILFLAEIFKNLPEAVLGAIIIQAVSGLLNPKKLMRLWRAHLDEFWLAAAAAAGVVVFNILPGILIGVLCSFALLIRRLDHPRIALLGRTSDNRYFENLDSDADDGVSAVPGTVIYAFRAPLIFPNHDRFTAELMDQIEKSNPPASKVVIDFDAIAEIDTTGAEALGKLHDTLASKHVSLVLARVNEGVRDLLERDGVLKTVGSDTLHPTVRDAVDATKGTPTS
jgi:high affinity sulfate transporter 1